VVFGVLSTATGLGGIVGSAAVNFFARKITAGKIIASFLILNGISWCLAIFSHEILVTTLLMFFSYAFSGIYNIIFSSLYQAIPPLNILGRVNTTVDSLITMAMPLGGLVAGYVLRVSSVQVVISSFGICAIIAGIFYLFQKWFMSLPLTNRVLRDKA
jgi:predicted MFS family arabinose efflux permease